VAAEPDGDAREAPDAGVPIEVHDVVPGKVAQDAPVLVHEPGLQVGHEELDLAVVVPRGDEQRDQHVAEVVPRVRRQPVHREHQGRHGVPGRARRRLRRAQRPHRHVVDVFEVLSGLVADAPLLADELAGGRDVENGAVGAEGACVAGDLADVVPGIREVADWLVALDVTTDILPDKLFFLHPVTCIARRSMACLLCTLPLPIS
jgi:hypothetical protein